MSSNDSLNKKVYFEMMRIIACSLVIFNHSSAYMLFSVSSGTKQFFYMCLTMITRINVPLFFMISGALLLRKNEEWTHVIRKRFMRIVYLLLLFNFILMSIYKIRSFFIRTDYDFSLAKYLYGFFQNQMDGSGPYWYLYSYLGLLFVLPMLQRMAKGVTKTEIIALLVLHFIVSSFLPILNLFLLQNQLPEFSFSENFRVPFAFEKAFFYTIAGYYIENNLDFTKVKKKHLFGLAAAGLAGILLSIWCTYQEAKSVGEFTQDYVQLFDYLSTIAAFILIKYMFVVAFPKLNEGKACKMICFGGSLTLGIYLLEPCLKAAFYDNYVTWAEPHFPTLAVSLEWLLSSMILGGLITYLLKKVPLIKRIL